MIYTTKMHTGLNCILTFVYDCIEKDLKQGKNIDLCLSAYNFWQEEECSGLNYIFNIDNAEDLKYLVDNDMITATDISLVMSQKSHFFVFEGETDARIKIVSMNELLVRLINNALNYMAYAIMYVGRCGKDSPYANIYDEYVTTYICDYFN